MGCASFGLRRVREAAYSGLATWAKRFGRSARWTGGNSPLLWLSAVQAFGLYAPQHLSPPEEFRRIFGAGRRAWSRAFGNQRPLRTLVAQPAGQRRCHGPGERPGRQRHQGHHRWRHLPLDRPAHPWSTDSRRPAWTACRVSIRRLRRARSDSFGTRVDTGRNHYMWLGTTKVFDAFTFAFVRTPAGWIWCHAYGFDATASTFIVECSPETWAGLGFGQLGLEESTARLEELFAPQLDGHRLVAQGPDRERAPWLSFRTVTNERWHHGNLVLAGDAAHTTHFTIGSGTKLAIADAIGLAAALGAHDDLGTALAAYERERRAALLLLQREARNSAAWFEQLPRYIDRGSAQFAALLHHRRSQLLTRMSPAGYYRLRRTSEEFALFDRLWHWASGRRRDREVRRGSRA